MHRCFPTLCAALLLGCGLVVASPARAVEDDSAGDESDSPKADEGSTVGSPDADSSQETAGEEKAVSVTRPVPGLAPVDGLGRPFPDPGLLKMARGWTVGGGMLTVGGASMMLTGMFLGSAAARGQITLSPEALYGLFGVMGAGSSMVFVGLPLMSSGRFTTGQLLRTIKGVPKVPRTVANERAYWLAHQRGMYGQAIVIGGGAGVLMGVLGVVAASFAVNSEFYDPRIWAIPVTGFSTGGGMIAFGLYLEKTAKEKMERIRDEVDPFRQTPEGSKAHRAPSAGPVGGPLALFPLPMVSATADGRGGVVPRASLNWMWVF